VSNDITKLAKRALELDKDATPGPWEYTPLDDVDDWTVYNAEFTFVKQDDSGVPVSEEDGAFIAESRTLLPELAAAYLELKEKYDKAVRLLVRAAGEDYNYIDNDDIYDDVQDFLKESK